MVNKHARLELDESGVRNHHVAGFYFVSKFYDTHVYHIQGASSRRSLSPCSYVRRGV